MSETDTQTDAVAALSRRIRQVEEQRRQCRDPVQRTSLGLELFRLRALQFKEWKQREGR